MYLHSYHLGDARRLDHISTEVAKIEPFSLQLCLCIIKAFPNALGAIADRTSLQERTDLPSNQVRVLVMDEMALPGKNFKIEVATHRLGLEEVVDG
jgi:hypothetical protein